MDNPLYCPRQVKQMTGHKRCLILPSTYRDSVVLMKLSAALNNMSGVHEAAVMMGTPQNKTILQEAGLLTAKGQEADVNDLLICVRSKTSEAAEHIVQEAKKRLSQLQSGINESNEIAPRSLESALRRLPEANLVCISVPGQYARREAQKALQKGLHVFLFSDHVELEAEEELKRLAAKQGLLMMGPECGTSLLNGVPLGFANQVPRGPVGLISASGTGLQQVACLLAHQGVGISQGIGVGGRDLHSRIGGQGMRTALRALAWDEDTKVIMIISKPPDPEVADRLIEEMSNMSKPCVLAFLGDDYQSIRADTLHFTSTLEHAALVAGALVRNKPIPSVPRDDLQGLIPSVTSLNISLHPEQRTIRGLYCGGTLAYEALWLLRRSLGEVKSNLDGTFDKHGSLGHVVLDLGAEEFTSGQPHPMIEPGLRRYQLLEIARQPQAAVVICDVILGWGAHPDPASVLAQDWQEAKALAHANGQGIICIASVCGTDDDPQNYSHQCRVLRENGIILAENNAQAVRVAASLIRPPLEERGTSSGAETTRQKSNTHPDGCTLPEASPHLKALLTDGPRVINLGLEQFADQLKTCNVPMVHVDWRPPAGGDVRLASLLERLK
jgi:FdrA protein